MSIPRPAIYAGSLRSERRDPARGHCSWRSRPASSPVSTSARRRGRLSYQLACVWAAMGDAHQGLGERLLTRATHDVQKMTHEKAGKLHLALDCCRDKPAPPVLNLGGRAGLGL